MIRVKRAGGDAVLVLAVFAAPRVFTATGGSSLATAVRIFRHARGAVGVPAQTHIATLW
jgi:hypothetical protein